MSRMILGALMFGRRLLRGLRADFIPYAIDYGHFRAISLLRRSQRERAIDRLLRDYNDIVGESGDQRPSIIAHSFGTYQVAALIERYPNVRFDKVIFAASIVRSDFDWPRILAAGRVNYVENDFGGADVWPKVAARLACRFHPLCDRLRALQGDLAIETLTKGKGNRPTAARL